MAWTPADPAEVERLWAAGPPKGVTFSDWFYGMVSLEWRGAEEEPHTVPCSQVRCVCGQDFAFKDGATRARCPNCGARYERT
jgi:hypothetical protein